MNITIKNKEIELKNKLKAILIYEQLTDSVFKPKTLTDMMLYFYSVIIANDKDIDLTFEELLELCDNDNSLFEDFQKWLDEEGKKTNLLNRKSKKK